MQISKKLENYIVNLYMIVTIIYIFFGQFAIINQLVNINTAYLLLSIAFMIYVVIINYKKYLLNKTDILLIVFISYLIILTLCTGWNIEGIKYLIFFITINLIASNLKNMNNWQKLFLKAIQIVTVIHCIFIIMHAIFPDFIINLDKFLLNKETWDKIDYAVNGNYYSGITAQPASAGLFATFLIAISFSKLIAENKVKYKNIINIINLIIGIIALFLSQKRAFLVAVIIAIFVILFIYNKNVKKIKINKKNMAILLSIILFLFFIIIAIPQFRNIIGRFFNFKRLLSGRETMYIEMFKWFTQSPLFGVGLGRAKVAFTYGGHNIYIQMLAECGIFGGILYFVYLFSLMIDNIKKVIKYKIIDYRMLFAIFIQTVLVVYGLTGNPIYDYSFLVAFMYIMMIPKTIVMEENFIEESKCNNTSI